MLRSRLAWGALPKESIGSIFKQGPENFTLPSRLGLSCSMSRSSDAFASLIHR